jgi:hypothetical protein
MAKIHAELPFEPTTWLQRCVLADLRTLCVGMEEYIADPSKASPSGQPLGGGNFLLVAGCCAAIEYCGHLYAKGSNGEQRAVAFIRDFLKPINPRYGEIDELLWKCFRNGTIHLSWPKRIEVPGQKAIRTGAGNEVGDPHLAPAPEVDGPSFMVNGRRLLADLEAAVAGKFGDWLALNNTADLIERAAPQPLTVSGSALLRQAANIRAWAKDNGPA